MKCYESTTRISDWPYDHVKLLKYIKDTQGIEGTLRSVRMWKDSLNGQYEMGSLRVICKQVVNWVSKGQLTRYVYFVLTRGSLFLGLNSPCGVKLDSAWVY